MSRWRALAPAESRPARPLPAFHEDEQVTGQDQIDDVAKMQVPCRPGRTLEHEQAARGAVGERLLSNAVGGEVIVKIAGLKNARHASKIVGCSALLGGVKPKWR